MHTFEDAGPPEDIPDAELMIGNEMDDPTHFNHPGDHDEAIEDPVTSPPRSSQAHRTPSRSGRESLPNSTA